MENFAEYILKEDNLGAKMEIVYFLSKKKKIFFDKSVILKTEIARNFINYSKLQLDNNLLLTACLLCNCRKVDNAQNIEEMHNYAKKGADYLRTIGFNERFCKICEEVNRYSNIEKREKEGDILELIDQFGGMLLRREEREGFSAEEALVLLEYRNLRDANNIYLQEFKDFVKFMEEINVSELVSMTAFKRLVKMYHDSDTVPKYMRKVIEEYEPKVDKAMEKRIEYKSKEMFKEFEDPNRPLFSPETTKKVLKKLNEQNLADAKES